MLIPAKLQHLVPSTSRHFCQEIIPVLGTRIRKVGIAQKVKTFSNSCSPNQHDHLAKIVGEVDGTKYG